MATDRQESNLERVRVGFEAFNRGDQERILSILDEDVEIVAAGAMLNAGTFRGHDGFRRWLAEWLDAWDGFEIQVERAEPVGERHVVAGVLQTGRGRGSGIDVEMEVAYMFEVGERTTVAMHLYPDWDEAVAVAERREKSLP